MGPLTPSAAARAISSIADRPTGSWCPVLHAHLPFVRHPEHERFLEEDWLFEALTEVYVPLVRLLDRLESDGVGFRLALSVSPTLLAMLLDPLLRRRYDAYLDRTLALAEREVARAERQAADLVGLARFYVAEIESVCEVYRTRHRSDLVGALRRHADAGRLELLTTAASHGLLPLLRTPQGVRAQVRVAVDQHARAFGRPPVGFWLPECAYAPGLEIHLKDAGLGYTVVAEHGLTDAVPAPRFGAYAPAFSPAGVAFLGRDPESAEQVWSADEGYPGDPEYREFYKDVGWELPVAALGDALADGQRRHLGIKYHRITGPVELEDKARWDPERARERAHVHARHFLEERVLQARELSAALECSPVIVSPYDAELFGHWWYEGPWFLEALLRALAAQQEISVATPTEVLERAGECDVVRPAESSWGAGGHLGVWLDPANDWVYPELAAAERDMVQLAQRFPAASGLTARALNQAARELLLAQASDWAFMMKMGTTVEYARRRHGDHVAGFRRLHAALVEGRVDEEVLTRMEARDNPFPDLDYRVYT